LVPFTPEVLTSALAQQVEITALPLMETSIQLMQLTTEEPQAGLEQK
jgi:hypothetical protein